MAPESTHLGAPRTPAVTHAELATVPLSLLPPPARPDLSVHVTQLESDDNTSDDGEEDYQPYEIDINDDFALNGESKRPVLDSGKKSGLWARRRTKAKPEIVHHIEGPCFLLTRSFSLPNPVLRSRLATKVYSRFGKGAAMFWCPLSPHRISTRLCC